MLCRMISDPTAVAKLVTRDVSTSARDGQPTRIVTARRTYRTDQADLWDAVTDPERLPRWFLPVEGDLTVGGRFQLVGNAGGVIERCDEPTSLAVTWELGGRMSWVRVVLTPADGGTILELSHEAPLDPEGQAFWDQFGPGAVGVGWDLAIMALGLHVESGEAVDPEAGLAFPTTPPGLAFIRACTDDWGRAAADAGDEPGAAVAAAGRTFAFYTGSTGATGTTPPET
jgi:uncharacterized protein YndB with AHSA1/START domain